MQTLRIRTLNFLILNCTDDAICKPRVELALRVWIKPFKSPFNRFRLADLCSLLMLGMHLLWS